MVLEQGVEAQIPHQAEDTTQANHVYLNAEQQTALIKDMLTLEGEEPPILTPLQAEVAYTSCLLPGRLGVSKAVRLMTDAGIADHGAPAVYGREGYRTFRVWGKSFSMSRFQSIPPSTDEKGNRVWGTRCIENFKDFTIVQIESRVGEHAVKAFERALFA